MDAIYIVMWIEIIVPRNERGYIPDAIYMITWIGMVVYQYYIHAHITWACFLCGDKTSW